MNTGKLNKNVDREQQVKRQQEEQRHRNAVEEKIYGKKVAEKRREVEELFQAAMDKINAMVEMKKKNIQRPGVGVALDNLKVWAKKNHEQFWKKVEEEIKTTGAVGIQDLYDLAPENTILNETFQRSIRELHEYGMTICAPLTVLGTDVFYYINQGDYDTVATLMNQIRNWEPEGWAEYEKAREKEAKKAAKKYKEAN